MAMAMPQLPVTPEVAAATRAFNAAYQAQLALVVPASPADIRYWGPHATITPTGDVAETAEVVAAKAELARAYSAALAATRVV